MRNLNVNDLYEAMRLVKAAHLEEEVQNMITLVQSNKLTDVRQAGLRFFINVIGSASDGEVQKRTYKLLAGIIECAPDDIGMMDPMELVDTMKELVNYIPKEKWQAFFKSLSALLSMS